MKYKLYRNLLALICTTLLAAPLSAEIYVSRVIVEFKPDEPARQDVQVRNAGEEPAYVTVEVREVLNPGAENEERVLVKNPEDISLLATPAKMVIPPGGGKLLRLANVGDGKSERVYRVKVKPVLPPLQEKQAGALLRVVVAYEILVFVYPDDPVEKFEISRTGSMLKITNQGNTNLFFGDGEQCSDGADCVELPSQRVYPGISWETELPADQPVSYVLTSFKGSRKLVVD